MTALHTDPGCTKILLEGVRSWLEDRHFNREGLRDLPRFHKLIKQQNRIGWHNLIKGRFAKEWQVLHDARARERGTYDQKITTRWTSCVIDTIWSAFWELWEDRNKDKHGKDLEARRRAEDDRVVEQILNMYELQIDMPEELQWIFATPIEDLVQKQDDVKAQWLHNYGPIIKQALRERAS